MRSTEVSRKIRSNINPLRQITTRQKQQRPVAGPVMARPRGVHPPVSAARGLPSRTQRGYSLPIAQVLRIGCIFLPAFCAFCQRVLLQMPWQYDAGLSLRTAMQNHRRN
jgi:hypothetical protein